MIRQATRKDIDTIAHLILSQVEDNDWVEESGMSPDIPTIKTIVNYHVRNKDAVVLVYEEDDDVVGVLVGALMPFLLDIRRHSAHEKMWAGTHTEELRNAFDNWARNEDACCVVMGCYEKSPEARLRRV